MCNLPKRPSNFPYIKGLSIHTYSPKFSYSHSTKHPYTHAHTYNFSQTHIHIMQITFTWSHILIHMHMHTTLKSSLVLGVHMHNPSTSTGNPKSIESLYWPCPSLDMPCSACNKKLLFLGVKVILKDGFGVRLGLENGQI